MENTKDSNLITRNYMDSILIEQRLIDAVEPNIEFELFGEKYSSPIMMPAFSHLKKFVSERENAMEAYAQAAKNMNLVNWIGMCENDEYEAFSDVNPKTIRIIKPYADKDKIFEQIKFAKEHGAIAVGMDIDHIFGMNGKYDVVFDDVMTSQSFDDIKAYVEYVEIPFIVKGVLSVSDALKCARAGVKGLLISHHSGRMNFAVPPLMVLPKIKEALSDYPDIKLFVDCSINSGAEAFKALCLGADAVAVGRAMMPDLAKDGSEGVERKVTKMNEELMTFMGFTGFSKLSDMEPSVLWIDGQQVK